MKLRNAVVALAFGAALAGGTMRFVGLDAKVFWQDEAISALRITGHTVAELNALFDDRSHRAAEVAALQKISPRRGVGATWSSFAREEPQRGLPYYLGARLWAGQFGTSVSALRAYSAALGLVGIYLAFLLGRSATRSLTGGALLAALIALSPFHMRYSQELREYVLFADAVLLAAWLFLRALDRPSPGRWSALAAACAFGFYVGPEFVLVVGAFGVVTAFERPWRGRVQGGFAAATLAASVAIAPWALLNIRAASDTAAGIACAATPYSLLAFAAKWTFNVGALFFDAELIDLRWSIVLVPLFALLLYSLNVTLQRARRVDRAARLALALIICTAFPLIAVDLLKHAHYEVVARYQPSTWIGLEMVAAIGMVTLTIATSRTKAALGFVAFAYALCAGTFSSIAGLSHPLWWDNNSLLSEAAVARAIPARPTPTILAERWHAVDVLVLSRYLEPQEHLLLLDSAEPKLEQHGSYYAFLPSERMRRGLAANAKLRNVSPAAVSTVPRLAQETDETGQPGNALWRSSL